VDLKEGRRAAWFLVPGLSQPPAPGISAKDAPPPQPGPEDTGAGYVQNNHVNGSGTTFIAGHIGTNNNYGPGGDR
jgi:hypothetical protein